LYQTEHFLDSEQHKRRYAGDVTWNARKREARRFIGLHKFLDTQTWYEPGDFKLLKSKASKFAFNFYDALAIDPSNPNLSATQFYEALVEQLGLEVEKSEWKTELVFDKQGQPVLKKDGTQKRKKYKLRRIGSESWQWFELFCDHRQAMKERREDREEAVSNSVPTSAENLYKNGGGWNIGQSNTGQGIKSGLESEKMETIQNAIAQPRTSQLDSSDKQPISTTTQATETDNVPTTTQNLYENGGGWNMTQSQERQGIEGSFSAQKLEDEIATTPNVTESLPSTNTQPTETDNVPTSSENVYKSEGGWNTNQSHTEQEIEDNFSPRKNEATNLELQDCLKQLRQVKKADDYWVLYEQSSQLVEEAWKLLSPPEQLRIQQICDEGVDPLSRWLEGERCLLWHPFAQEKWGLATVKQVVRGACGFIYVLRDDGFGLHLGREKLHLIEPINIESS
jgi:hypothetical protein